MNVWIVVMGEDYSGEMIFDTVLGVFTNKNLAYDLGQLAHDGLGEDSTKAVKVSGPHEVME